MARWYSTVNADTGLLLVNDLNDKTGDTGWMHELDVERLHGFGLAVATQELHRHGLVPDANGGRWKDASDIYGGNVYACRPVPFVSLEKAS